MRINTDYDKRHYADGPRKWLTASESGKKVEELYKMYQEEVEEIRVQNEGKVPEKKLKSLQTIPKTSLTTALKTLYPSEKGLADLQSGNQSSQGAWQVDEKPSWVTAVEVYEKEEEIEKLKEEISALQQAHAQEIEKLKEEHQAEIRRVEAKHGDLYRNEEPVEIRFTLSGETAHMARSLMDATGSTARELLKNSCLSALRQKAAAYEAERCTMDSTDEIADLKRQIKGLTHIVQSMDLGLVSEKKKK